MAARNSNNNDLLVRLHRAVREFPRYNQFLVTVLEPSLTPVEVHILVEVENSPDVIQKDMGILLELDKVQLSRAIRKLLNQSLITASPTPEDRRQNSLSLTKVGSTVLRDFDSQANARLVRFTESASLKPAQVRRLSSFLDSFADSFDTAPSKPREGEHVLRAPIRRLTRAFGLLGNTSLNTGLVLLEWQILLTVAEHSNRLSPSTLSELLSVDRPTVAVALRNLKKRRLISKRKNPKDSRSELIHCTKSGFSLIRKTEQQAVAGYGLQKTITESDVALVERFIRGAAIDFYVTQKGFCVREFSTEQELQKARLLKVQEMSSVEYCKKLPGSLFCENNICIGLYQDTELLAAAELEHLTRNSKPRYRVTNLFSDHSVHPDSLRAFILQSINSALDGSIPFDHAEYNDVLSPSAQVSSSLGTLF